jgi:hypothetical protein
MLHESKLFPVGGQHSELSQELRAAGAAPQFAGENRCSLKKYWVRRKKTTLFFLARGVGTLAPTDRLMQNIFRFSLASFEILDPIRRIFVSRFPLTF